MKIAFRTHDLGVRGLSGAIQKIKGCGIDSVQLVAYKFLDEISYTPLALNDDNTKLIGKAFKSENIDISLIGAYFNPVHSNKEKVEKCIEIFKEYIKYSKNLGCNIVGSETGSFNDDKWTYNPKNRTDEALKIVVEKFTHLADYASKFNAYVGIEGAAGHVCYNVATLKRAVDTIGRENVKVIFDIYNYLDESNYLYYLDILDEGLKTFKNIHIFHIKDCVFEDGKLKQVAPSKGIFDFDKILKKIKDYDKNATLVLEGTTGEDIQLSVKFIRETWNNA